ncbi:hypothetical protein OIU84_012874 [Salix udensis]|uniref:Uncharacterized protein n=1 Tax=Salix udensis TaxID=889485 RepID=A0AAD6NTV6_9ROSI|nr:hypothetical protein OIU84_012874 [Salix udensis]
MYGVTDELLLYTQILFNRGAGAVKQVEWLPEAAGGGGCGGGADVRSSSPGGQKELNVLTRSSLLTVRKEWGHMIWEKTLLLNSQRQAIP